jgi:hypothetical protein
MLQALRLQPHQFEIQIPPWVLYILCSIYCARTRAPYVTHSVRRYVARTRRFFVRHRKTLLEERKSQYTEIYKKLGYIEEEVQIVFDYNLFLDLVGEISFHNTVIIVPWNTINKAGYIVNTRVPARVLALFDLSAWGQNECTWERDWFSLWMSTGGTTCTLIKS